MRQPAGSLQARFQTGHLALAAGHQGLHDFDRQLLCRYRSQEVELQHAVFLAQRLEQGFRRVQHEVRLAGVQLGTQPVQQATEYAQRLVDLGTAGGTDGARQAFGPDGHALVMVRAAHDALQGIVVHRFGHAVQAEGKRADVGAQPGHGRFQRRHRMRNPGTEDMMAGNFQRHVALARQFLAHGLQRQLRCIEQAVVQMLRPGQLFVLAFEQPEQDPDHAAGQRPHQQHAQTVEQGVEQRQRGGNRRIKRQGFADTFDQLQHGRQDQQRHDPGQHVEEHMRGRHAPGVGRGLDDGEDGRGGGTDVGTDHHGGGGLQPDRAAGCGGQGQRHGGTGRLHAQGQQEAQPDVNQVTEHGAGAELVEIDICRHAGKGVLQQVDAKEKHAEAGQCQPARTPATLAAGHVHGHADADGRQGKQLDLHLEPDQRYQPAGEGGADIAAENHPDGLRQGQQAGIDEADGGNGDGTGRLHQCSQAGADQQRLGTVAGKAGQNGLERTARQSFQAVGHLPHAQHEQAQSADKAGNHEVKAHHG